MSIEWFFDFIPNVSHLIDVLQFQFRVKTVILIQFNARKVEDISGRYMIITIQEMEDFHGHIGVLTRKSHLLLTSIVLQVMLIMILITCLLQQQLIGLSVIIIRAIIVNVDVVIQGVEIMDVVFALVVEVVDGDFGLHAVIGIAVNISVVGIIAILDVVVDGTMDSILLYYLEKQQGNLHRNN